MDIKSLPRENHTGLKQGHFLQISCKDEYTLICLDKNVNKIKNPQPGRTSRTVIDRQKTRKRSSNPHLLSQIVFLCTNIGKFI